jgi:hypothetical protein
VRKGENSKIKERGEQDRRRIFPQTMDRLTKDIQLRILRDAFFVDFAGVCVANEEEIPKSLNAPYAPTLRQVTRRLESRLYEKI